MSDIPLADLEAFINEQGGVLPEPVLPAETLPVAPVSVPPVSAAPTIPVVAPVVTAPAEPIAAAPIAPSIPGTAPLEVLAPEPPKPEPIDPRAGWSPVERLAVDLRTRNPDLTLAESLERANAALGTSTSETPVVEKTLDDQLAEIRATLADKGANSGLFNEEINQLIEQQSTLIARKVREDERALENETQSRQTISAQRAESRGRVIAKCSLATQQDSPIGKAISDVITELEGSKILTRGDSPEQVYAIAKTRLTPTQLAEVEALESASLSPATATVAQAPVGGETPTIGTNAPAEQLKVSTASPVSGAARSEQPVNRIIPTGPLAEQLRQFDTESLEEVLNGGKSAFFMR